MHRWFFAIEREVCEPKPEQPDEAEEQEEQKDKGPPEEIVYTVWPFCVTVRGVMHGNEQMAVTGNCDELGNWDPKKAVVMQRQGAAPKSLVCCSHRFAATISIPRNKDIEYRYCVVGQDSILNEHIIRFWEVHPQPRIIRTCHNLLKQCDVFGKQDTLAAESRIDRGWATFETIVQFRIFNAPFLWQKQCPRLLYVYIQPMYEREAFTCSEPHPEPVRLTDISLFQSLDTLEKAHLAFTEVCNLRHVMRLHYQALSGARCGPEDLQLYQCSIGNVERTLYRLDLYTFAQKAAEDEPPYHYGYGFITPDQLLNSEGTARVKITCASTHRPLIEMNVKYLMIRPLPEFKCDMRITWERYWKPLRNPLDIGHRGAGVTYRLKSDVHRENTIFGFRQAQLHHADMVELDVHLTKDAKVVVYHDFSLKFAQCSTLGIQKMITTHDVFVFPHEQLSRLRLLAMGGVKRGEHLEVPIDAFNYEELRLATALEFTASEGCGTNCDQLLQDQQPFPLLSDLFEPSSGLAETLGFIIEIKWPQQDATRRWQEGSFKPSFDRNFYVDTILELVLSLAGKRRIVFCSFDADICAMVRYKQNLYPVTLLIADPDRPIQFLDQRVSNIENATNMAFNLELLGLYLHANILLHYPLYLGQMRELQMCILTYGPQNNGESVREKIRRYGIMGITYDRIDQKDQVGEAVQGIVCCIDTMTTRLFIRLLQETEKLNKCIQH
ncbi:hypothetical protein KR222_000030 [Zaprionus bogoriensis]|nr:hypothetical protein KR222_000030 [Zaprionus bogoriensis]